MAVGLNLNARHDALSDGDFLATDREASHVDAMSERGHGTDLQGLDVLEEVLVCRLEQCEVTVIAHTDHSART